MTSRWRLCGQWPASWPGPTSSTRCPRRLPSALGRPAPRLHGLDAGTQYVHEVDNLRLRPLRGVDDDLVSIPFCLHQRVDLLAVRVVISSGIPLRFHRLDEELRHRDFSFRQLTGTGRSGSSFEGERISSEKYIVSNVSTSSSGRIATGYSLFLITSVPMATLLDSLIACRSNA